MALFVALGGTSYAAITLPANSVGKSQIRTAASRRARSPRRRSGTARSVRTRQRRRSRRTPSARSEIRPSAIDSDELADKGIGAADLADAAKTTLADMNGVTFRARATGAGVAAGGNATAITRTGLGEYTVTLGRDVSACQYSATAQAPQWASPPPRPRLRTPRSS